MVKCKAWWCTSGKKLLVSGDCPHCPHQDFIRDNILIPRATILFQELSYFTKNNHTVPNCSFLYHFVLSYFPNHWSTGHSTSLPTPGDNILIPRATILYFVGDTTALFMPPRQEDKTTLHTWLMSPFILFSILFWTNREIKLLNETISHSSTKQAIKSETGRTMEVIARRLTKQN